MKFLNGGSARGAELAPPARRRSRSPQRPRPRRPSRSSRPGCRRRGGPPSGGSPPGRPPAAGHAARPPVLSGLVLSGRRSLSGGRSPSRPASPPGDQLPRPASGPPVLRDRLPARDYRLPAREQAAVPGRLSPGQHRKHDIEPAALARRAAHPHLTAVPEGDGADQRQPEPGSACPPVPRPRTFQRYAGAVSAMPSPVSSTTGRTGRRPPPRS